MMTMRLKKYLWLFFILAWVSVSPATAQFYPTQHRPNVDWKQLSTPHFKILFPAGEDSAAYETARLLEHHYPGVQNLTGGTLSNFPVILSNYNDRSNGFVTSLHFRSEIDIPPNKGKLLNPKTGSWLKNVVPHELVHAMQFNNVGGFGLGRFVNIFSPDLARSIHGATPSGLREGLATYYESSSVTPGGGRGNHPYFNNQFNAVFDSPQRWSMGQTVHSTDYTRPFNRIYLGGYTFTNWLQKSYGDDTSRDAIDFNVRWPFLGYGIALKHSTGKWPSQLYDEFKKDKEDEITSTNSSTTSRIQPLPLSFEGADVRRPKWLSDSMLIFHGSFYNAKPGFYEYSLNNNSARRLITTRSVSDYNYTLSDDKKTLIYSYNQADLIAANAFKATLIKATLTDGSQQELQKDERLYAPAFSSDSSVLALQTSHSYSTLVEISVDENNGPDSLFSNPGRQLVSVDVNPVSTDSLALVVNHKGNQALWLASKKSLKKDLASIPDISFTDGSIFDPVWHPDGSRVLFSADFSGSLQVYEYDTASGAVTQLTNVRYNAFEASYSPDGNRIAFIMQKENEQLPAVLNRSDFYGMVVPEPSKITANESAIVNNKTVNNWSQSSYSTGFSWVKPRTILPAFEEISGSNRFEIGAGLHSSDLLQQQAYSLVATTAEGRFWYDLTYLNKQFFPGFKARFFSDPAFRRFRFEPSDNTAFTQTFLRQERSFALSVPMNFSLEQNVAFSRLFIEPEIRQSQLRYFNSNGSSPSNFSDATIGNIFAQFNYKLQQDIRSVQPNSGVLLYSEVEHFFRSEGLTLNTIQGPAPLNFAKPTALRTGILGYLSPLRRWNQSLRVGLESITQTNRVFDNQSLVSNGFSEPVLPFANNLLSFSTRYTIPLLYPDNGGLLLPLYLSSIYITAFSNTVADPASGNFLDTSRTIIGGGLRVQFRISNLSIDIGAGIGFEPSRNTSNFFIGTF